MKFVSPRLAASATAAVLSMLALGAPAGAAVNVQDDGPRWIATAAGPAGGRLHYGEGDNAQSAANRAMETCREDYSTQCHIVSNHRIDVKAVPRPTRGDDR